MRSDIAYRTLEVIRAVVDASRRTKELEEETGIPSSSWKNVWNKKQRPTIHMIEALARRWPQYAFWLVTGITDEQNGHTAPRDAWTCNQDKAQEEVEIAAKEYFDLKIFYQNMVYGMDSAADCSDTKAEDYCEDTNSNTMHRGNNLLSDITKSEPKKKLKELDYAIASIAFNKRQRILGLHFFDDNTSSIEAEQYHQLMDRLMTNRSKK